MIPTRANCGPSSYCRTIPANRFKCRQPVKTATIGDANAEFVTTSKNGKWICVLDGDNIEVDGTLKVVAKKNFIERFFVEREPKRDARFLPKRHGPMGPAQQEHHKRISGGEVLKIDSGAIRGKIIGCCFFLLIAIVIVILFSLGIIS